MKGKVIFYIEGNHDFHLEKLFSKRYKDYFDKSFIYKKDHVEIQKGKLKIYLSHGDNFDRSLNYQVTKFILRNSFTKFLINSLPNCFVSKVGKLWSEKSRKKNNSFWKDTNQLKYLKDKVRSQVSSQLSNDCFDLIVSGHSHVKDEFKITNSSIYLNNGYPLKSKIFISINNDGHQFHLLP